MQKSSDNRGAVTVPTRIPGIDSSSDDDRRCSGLRRNDRFRDSSDDDMQGGGRVVQDSKRAAGRIVRGQRNSHAARRSGRLALSHEKDVEAAKPFQRLVVQEQNCLALMWNQGRGRQQCCLLPMPGSRYCKKHKNAPHGEVRGPIPANKLDQFRSALLKPEEDSKQLYARYLMWGVAATIAPDISSLSGFTPEQY